MPLPDRHATARATAASRRKGIAALGLAGAALISLSVLPGFVSKEQPGTDLCVRDAPVPTRTAILIDASDPFTGAQRQAAAARLTDAMTALPTGGRLMLFAVNPANAYEPTLLLSRCAPPNGTDVNPLTGTASVYRKEWATTFRDPVLAAFDVAVRQPATRRSPIMESIAAISRRADFAPGTDRTLVVESDGLEHRDGGYSHYATRDFEGALRRSPLARDAAADLTGARIQFNYVRRPEAEAIQGEHHLDFWRRWLARQGRPATVGIASG